MYSQLIKIKSTIMKRSFLNAAAASMLIASVGFTACNNGEAEALQAQVDSLTAKVESQAQDLDNYQNCLTLFSEGLDSLAAADNNLMVATKNKEGRISKEMVKESLSSYADMLVRQRERINELQSKLNSTNQEQSKLQGLLNFLKKQIDEKDATIKDLQARIDQKDFDISILQAEVGRLNAANTMMANTIEEQGAAIDVATEMLNEAFYIVGSSKELKTAGVLSKKLLGSAKINADIDASKFTRIDIRKVTEIRVDSKNITLHSSHPSNSYRIDVDKKIKSSTLRILDEVAFWSNTRYLVIEK